MAMNQMAFDQAATGAMIAQSHYEATQPYDCYPTNQAPSQSAYVASPAPAPVQEVGEAQAELAPTAFEPTYTSIVPPWTLLSDPFPASIVPVPDPPRHRRCARLLLFVQWLIAYVAQQAVSFSM